MELWIADFDDVRVEWGWLLGRLVFVLDAECSGGQSWSAGGSYLTLTTSPNVSMSMHDRRRAGVNHLAFKASTEVAVDAIMADAPAHGWRSLYADRYPRAGGKDHYAGCLENATGFTTEIVADLG